MNKEETLTLFAQGQDAWNAWAAEMRERRASLEYDNAWVAGPDRNTWNDATREWYAAATVDFSEHLFEDDVTFENFVFPGNAVFERATFAGEARYQGATFTRDANFENAILKRDAWFEGATFLGNAGFHSADFSGNALFHSARFSGYVAFEMASFTGDAGYRSAEFRGEVDFGGATFRSGAGFESSTFLGNAWFSSATFTGSAWFDGATFTGNSVFERATLLGEARFQRATFMRDANFENANLIRESWFEGATFLGNARFQSANFSGNVQFQSVTFSGDADFQSATLLGNARFESATFTGSAWLDSATFKGSAQFNQAKFETVASFAKAQFESVANFHAMRGGLSFSLADALFLAVPDFTEANFKEAPRLDNLHIEPGRFAPFYVSRIREFFKTNPEAAARWRARRFRNWRFFSGDGDLSAKWRALKGLAVKGHDHEQELNFFRGELLAQRWLPGKRLRPLFLAGLAYQVFSDFGRSMTLPLLWLLAGIAGFGCAYLGQFPALAVQPWSGGFLWAWEWAKSFWRGGPQLTCVAGQGDPVVAALQLSVHKALPFLGLGSSGHIDQFYACLYGVKPSPLSSRLIPEIPGFVAGIGVFQILFSTVMIFLFLLALRNHFRIK